MRHGSELWAVSNMHSLLNISKSESARSLGNMLNLESRKPGNKIQR